VEGALRKMKSKKGLRVTVVILIVLFAPSFYFLPYYVSKPGMAKELHPIIEVENGYDGEGNFMLTTVRMGRANVYSFLIAKLSDYQKVYHVEEIKGKHESDEEYNVRQLYLMDSSKLNAIEVAYKRAGLPIEYIYNGVYVLNVVSGMPANGKLQPADRIFKVDGREFSSSDQFMEYIDQKKAGDSIEFTYEREGKIDETTMDLALFNDEDNKGKIGIGISLVDDKEIEVEPDVKVNSDEIGGPSAGFMFSLEIYNQLTEEDLTRGYEIAGTGTISSDGHIGAIGGIDQKVIAANKAGAEIFLAPNENGVKNSNYQVALKTAEDIGSDMKVIPVDTFDQAVERLLELEPKK
jgi:PDZ domain-containing protein